MLATGAIWFVASLALGWLDRSGVHAVGYPELLAEGALLVATLLPFGWLRRDALFFNTANRRLYGGLILTALTVEVHWIACLLLDVPVLMAVGLTALYYAYAFATLGIVLDRRLGLGALAMGLTAVANALMPELSIDLLGLGGGIAVFLILASWAERGAPSVSQT